jgi:hypothetical protein
LFPKRAGRELLSNCFAAIRPDAEWFGFFREGMERVVGPLDEFARDSENSLALQAARRIAQEESFGNASLVRELNLSEILSRAKLEADQLLEDKSSAVEFAEQKLLEERRLAAQRMEEQAALFRVQSERERELAEQQAAAERARIAQEHERALKAAADEARQELAAQLEEANRRRAHRWADRIITVIRAIAVLAFIACGGLWLTKGDAPSPNWFYPVAVLVGLVSFLEFLHLIGIPLVERLLEGLRERVAKTVLRFFQGS